MKAKFIRQYRKAAVTENNVEVKPSRLVFVYGVEGTPEQLAEYKKLKGEKHIIDESTKMPLFFGIRYAGKNVALVLNSEKTEWNFDTTEQDQIKNLMQQGYSYEHAKDIAKN